MESFKTNQAIWADIYKAGKNNLSYPNENLVRYLYYLYPDKNFSDLKVLDYGFGSGNNLKHLDNLGCDVYGVEISEHAKKLTLQKLRSDFNADKLFIMNQEAVIPYSSNYFDLIISWQVLCYNTVETLTEVLNTLKSKLKPGGKFIGTMLKMEDISIVNSVPSLSNKYERTSNETMGNQEGSKTLGIPGEKDIYLLFNMFSNIQIGYFETKLMNTVGAHWVIYGENK
jgi:SAM-dependent methyltransferase